MTLFFIEKRVFFVVIVEEDRMLRRPESSSAMTYRNRWVFYDTAESELFFYQYISIG